MTNFKAFGRLALCAAWGAWFGFCPQGVAQSQDTTTANIASPIVVKDKPVKPVWMNAEVVHADLHTIIVRERDNSMMIHTFTYSEKAQDKMNQIVENGGYQVGDQVKIRWMPGGSEALDIKGRPSKP
jgi:hypothetical protein